MSAAIERVAQALCDVDKGFWDHEASREHYRHAARVAIAAMGLPRARAKALKHPVTEAEWDEYMERRR